MNFASNITRMVIENYVWFPVYLCGTSRFVQPLRRPRGFYYSVKAGLSDYLFVCRYVCLPDYPSDVSLHCIIITNDSNQSFHFNFTWHRTPTAGTIGCLITANTILLRVDSPFRFHSSVSIAAAIVYVCVISINRMPLTCYWMFMLIDSEFVLSIFDYVVFGVVCSGLIWVVCRPHLLFLINRIGLS